MNEFQAIADLLGFEADRRAWVIQHASMSGFTTAHGARLSAYAETCESLQKHLSVPKWVDQAQLTHESRKLLVSVSGECGNHEQEITNDHIVTAREFVEGLFGVDLDATVVQLVPSSELAAGSFGVVYSCDRIDHIIRLPRASFDPMLVLVGQYAVSAHYTLKRRKKSLAALITDDVAQAFTANYAMLRYATSVGGRSTLLRLLSNVTSWEFAKGLSYTPEKPLGFVASDLGAELMKTYGAKHFQKMLQQHYEAGTHGSAIRFGAFYFTGFLLAINALGKDKSVAQFMELDSGDRTLGERLDESLPSLAKNDFAWVEKNANLKLAKIIAESQVAS